MGVLGGTSTRAQARAVAAANWTNFKNVEVKINATGKRIEVVGSAPPERREIVATTLAQNWINAGGAKATPIPTDAGSDWIDWHASPEKVRIFREEFAKIVLKDFENQLLRAK
jgi:hypothetical protein